MVAFRLTFFVKISIHHPSSVNNNRKEMEIDFGKMCRICLAQQDCIDMTDENRVIISTKEDQEDVSIPIQNAFFYFSSLRVINCDSRTLSAT